MGTALDPTIAADALALVLDLLHGEAIGRRGGSSVSQETRPDRRQAGT
jgi:hypothetical protein